jgi:molybdenum cofactor cytidylyltransferase
MADSFEICLYRRTAPRTTAVTAAIILSGGESRRMGTAKALLPFRDGTFLSHLAGNLELRCTPVIAVFGADAAQLMDVCPEGVMPVDNPNYAMGMLTSLQTGLWSIPDDADSALFTLIDHPAVAPSTVDALLESPAIIAIPRYQGKRGHPVLIRREIIDEFINEPVTSKVHDVINRHETEIDYIDTDDPGVTDDIDDPALYQKLLSREAAHE